MSILGVIVRTRPEQAGPLALRLAALPGLELAETPGPCDGRLVLVIEDCAEGSAAATLGRIALWPEVLSTSLVYEYSGPDSPAPDEVKGYRDWRQALTGGPADRSGV